jgi:hypothetical protein
MLWCKSKVSDVSVPVKVENEKPTEQVQIKSEEPGIVEFVKNLDTAGNSSWAAEVKQQQSTFESDYNKLTNGGLDYATMRARYG